MVAINRTQKSEAVSRSSGAQSSQVKLSMLKNADRGLQAKLIGDKLVIKGTARGVETRNPYALDGDGTNDSDFAKIQEFGGSFAFDFDKDRMPKFDTSNGFTEKNKWYFAHGVSIGTKKGQTAAQVAKALAAEVKGYDVKVKVRGDVATLQLIRR